MIFPAKYGTSFTFEFPMVVRGSNDLAASGDWTPATGDTKISKDGGNVANTTNNPSAVGGTGSKLWTLTLTATEMQAARVTIQIVDSATKAVEDQTIVIVTFGNASAHMPFDLGTASTPQTGDNYARLGAPAGASVSADVAAVKAQTQTINNDTDDIQTRLPAALVGGKMDSHVNDIAANAITAAALAADAGAEIADAVWDEATAGHAGAGSTGKAITDTLAAVDTEVAAIKAVTDALPNGGALTGIAADLDDIQSRLPAALTADGNIKADALKLEGQDPSDLVNAAADVALADYDGPTHAEMTSEHAALSSEHSTINGNVSAVGAAVVTETDEIDAAIAALSIPNVGAIADAVWDEATADHQTAGSTGKALTDAGAAGTPPTATEIADAVWDEQIADHLGVGSTGEALDNAGAAGTPPTADEIAEAVLTKDIADVEPAAGFHTVYGMVAKQTNDTDTATDPTKLRVKRTDGSTLVDQNLTRDGSALPVVKVTN